MKKFLIVIAVILVGYYLYDFFKESKEWITTREGVKIWMIREKNNDSYSWKGNVIGNLAHSQGVLTVNRGNKLVKKKINAFWGSIDKSDWVSTKNGYFLGGTDNSLPDTYGVLIKKNKTFIGNFDEGELEGNIMIFNNQALQYRGGYEDGKYNGHGALYQNGEFKIGDWKDGYLTKGFFEEKSEVASKIWYRMIGDKPDTSEKKDKLSKDEINALDKEEFCEYLSMKIEHYILKQTNETVEKRTDFWSFHPLRMFWQTLFSSRENRTQGWMEELEENGLSRLDLEFFINSHLSDYNQNNIYKHKLKTIKLDNLDKDIVFTDKTFNLINELEHAEWSENFWFDGVLAFVLAFVMGLILAIIIPPSIPFLITYGWIIDGIFVIIALIISIWLSITGDDIIKEVIGELNSNYLNYLIEQKIFYKILN